ncbi:general transcription factor 3C polypeptide 2 isoform X1 [Phyllopteryx taeniolatus]|uniref:general transcription factor 3C polypeptide 2 isoform X1 n=1 Tax=Phyllopteryx taeniolatus TaxID=161469 RepID=UPI002AD4CBCA|nr:general transcription factor 3C polypeptide 2 isoform X1 [Phyllopteryx taeniolatus]XP_061609863.1 general transcription factor 3C polypeptide 2 isoform X1 [Phyllopteryx taeniolatus]XP_061609864.1 general transcription factor 3C polypeptide 2 isoform X1 [Phyllopteryx taeniolatus]XP_061609865.1 general transcription factor 3C polypeptide 2 isoform X1 [Phyllopteryx taeniolatus]
MVKETAPEDVDDPERGQETPSKPAFDLTPSSKGRQRKINSRYFDYDTSDANEDPRDDDVPARKAPTKAVGAATTGKTPGKRGRPRKVPLANVDDFITPHVLNGDISSQTIAGVTNYDTSNANEDPRDDDVPARKPPTKEVEPAIPRKTPGKRGRPRKVPLASVDDFKTPQALNGDIASQTNASASPCTEASSENGTPKPKRKYVRKQIVHVEPVPPSEKSLEEEPEELQPGGRPRRSAAKMAMKFLHAMVQEEVSRSSEGAEATSDVITKAAPETTEERSSQEKKGRRGRKRKCSDGDAAEDEDFVPDVAGPSEAEEEEEDDQEVTDSDSHDESSANRNVRMTSLTLLEIVENQKKFRDEQLCSWVFPEWLPSSSVWHRVPSSELETYLPQEFLSAAFKVSRDGCDEEMPLQRLNRFESLPAHPECWDMHLYTGGPVWPMEWCPTPDNAVASQYLAVACRRDMEEQHYFHKTYSGPALVQLWDVGTLDYNTRPSSKPALAYGLVLDQGFVCHLKWCPSGGWELPTTQKEAPLLPRLGLLAVATSMGVVAIYSLPHPDALRASQDHQDSGDASQPTSIYKPNPVVTLKLGSLKAPRLERSGQVLSMDWLPIKPHDVIAVGFYDGMVGLWDLTTKSALLRFQESHDSPSLLPYKCFLAHKQAVRALTFCAASRHLVATAGEDRLLKTWDLRRLYGPITVQKRSLINDIFWPANAPGLFYAQDGAFTAHNSNGVHYFDHQMNSYFAVPRMTAIWSISYSDWLNTLVTSDMLGEVIISMLPSLFANTQHIKKTVKKRFPVYFTSMERHDATPDAKEEEQEVRGEEVKKENDRADGGRDGGEKADAHPRLFDTYKETERKYYLHHTDNNMKFFSKMGRLWKQMRDTEFHSRLNMDEMPLASLHKVRLSPNLSCHTWMASGGQAGLVRLNCIRGLNNQDVEDVISRARGIPEVATAEVASPDAPQETPCDAPL